MPTHDPQARRSTTGGHQSARWIEAKGWELSEESQALLQEAIEIETDPETKQGDRLIKSAHRAAEYGLGSIHQAWIVESWTSHATYMSATQYITNSEDGLATELHPFPKPYGRRTLVSTCIAVHLVLTGYEHLVPNALGGRLAEWQERYERLALQLKADDTKGGK